MTSYEDNIPQDAGRLPWQTTPPARRRTDDLAERARLRRAAAGRSRAKLFSRVV